MMELIIGIICFVAGWFACFIIKFATRYVGRLYVDDDGCRLAFDSDKDIDRVKHKKTFRWCVFDISRKN